MNIKSKSNGDNLGRIIAFLVELFCLKGEDLVNKKFGNILIVLFVFIIILIFWTANNKIIDSNYDKLTIRQPDETTMVITDKGEIEQFIEIINTSPRDFFLFDMGFKYDYLPHGMFIFENDEEKFELGFFLSEENSLIVLTNHWEIKTEVPFPW